MGVGSPIVALLLFLLAAPAILHPATLGGQLPVPVEVGLPGRRVVVQEIALAPDLGLTTHLDALLPDSEPADLGPNAEISAPPAQAGTAEAWPGFKPELVPPTRAETRAKGLLAPLAAVLPLQPATRPQILAYRAGGPAPIVAADILANAERLLGTRYVWGGTTEAGLDCSAFVSLAWKVSRQTTDTIHRVSVRIGKDELMPGDALNMTIAEDARGYGHIRLFDRWVNAERTLMWVYEETPPRAIHRIIPYDPRYTPIRRFNYVVSADGSLRALADPVRTLVGAIQSVAAGPSGGALAATTLTGPVRPAVEASRPIGAAQPALLLPPSIPRAEQTPAVRLPQPNFAVPTPRPESRRDGKEGSPRPARTVRPAPQPTPIPSPQPPVVDGDDLLPTPNPRRRATPAPSRRTPTPIVTPTAPSPTSQTASSVSRSAIPTPPPASPTPARPSPTPQGSSPMPVAPRPDPTADPTAARPPVATATPGKPAESAGAARPRQEPARRAEPSPTPVPRVDNRSGSDSKSSGSKAAPAQPTPAPKETTVKPRGERNQKGEEGTGERSKGRK